MALGHKILSSCEHGNQGHYRECANLAKKYDLAWRYVAEAYMVKDRRMKDSANCHLILAARTKKGVGDLNFALSEANLSGFYYRPRLDMDLLLSLNPHDVFMTTACVGGVFKYGQEEAKKIILTLARHFDKSFMLEVQYHNTDKQKEVNTFLLDLHKQHGIPLIMGTDSHYIYPEDKAQRDLRLAANNIQYADEEGWLLDYPSGKEAYERFVQQGILSPVQIEEAIRNTHVFLSFEDVSFDKAIKLPTLYPELTQAERNQKYLDLVYDEWSRYSQGLAAEEKRVCEEGIRYETDTIVSTNMSDYFLLDHAIVKRAKDMGGVITATGRGSGVSYFTNTLLGLSSVDRFSIPVEMFPDRFISKDRLLSGSVPDIDSNVWQVDIFAKAQEELLGEWRSAPMVAFGTLRRLSAWKMYCRANEVSFDTANAISGQLKALGFAQKNADDGEEISLDAYVPAEYMHMVKESEQYLGIIDSLSPHPCAYLLCTEDIRREIGIIRVGTKGKSPVYAAFIDGQTAEKYGYIKNDWLAVDVVQVNREVFTRISRPQPTANELISMTKNDKDTWRIYEAGLTMGINQVEQVGTRDKVMRYKPKNITELAGFVAAVRPSFQSMINTFLARKRFSYGIPAFDKLIQTKEMPDSWLLYQEQVMKTLQYGGFTAPESYAAIKAIAKKHPEKVLPMKAKFLETFQQRILTDEPGTDEEYAMGLAAKVWRIIEDATSYSFCASHAVCVALDSLYGAFAKAHYPLEFYTTLLNLYGQKGDKARIAQTKAEMKRGFGIRVVPPKFKQDNRDYYIDRSSNAISDALHSVKHVSKRVSDTLYALGNNFYPCFTDVLHDMENHSTLNTKTIDILIRMGYFAEFGSSGKLLKLYDEFRNGTCRFAKYHIEKTQLLRLQALRKIEAELSESDISMQEQMRFEVMHYGTPLTTYPACKAMYAVLEVDDTYSPRLQLYNISSSNTGEMKMRKGLYKESPVAPGDLIQITQWESRPKYRYMKGVPVRTEGTEFWIIQYNVLT